LLVNKATGKKFGKSEQGTVWLDPAKTSPFQFYQFWLNVGDEDVEEYLLKMTLLSRAEIDAVLELHTRDPKERHGQQTLAREVTMLVHGEGEANTAERASQALFGEGVFDIDTETAEMLKTSAPSSKVSADTSILDALISSALASSKREARQFLSEKAVTLNGVVVDEERKLSAEDFKNGIALLKRGKKNVSVLALR
jgi:tyrosyl-tRNA synthetase